MCTLTYLPTKDGFILTHNRDERQDRLASEKIKLLKHDDHKVFFPQDLEANGSWIAFSEKGRAVALLNGGSEPHQRKESYRHSRGLVVLDNFKYPDQDSFYRDYNLQNIEPFTLIVRDKPGLWQIVHDENRTKLQKLDANKTGIWSSTTLYTKEVRQKRSDWFYHWLNKQNKPSADEVRYFHKSAGDGDRENDLIMSRWGILKTVSITQIQAGAQGGKISYEDLVKDSRDEISFYR